MNHLFYPIKEIQEAIEAQIFIQNEDSLIRTLLTDSRRMSDQAYGLFFALNQRRNGHDFIPDAYQAGIRSFVISQNSFDYTAYPEANFYLVKDTLQALQDLAAYHRSKFNYPVIGITGSNGKTIVKEWLFQLLSPEYRIIRSPKSYNSQIGVALSVWEMTDDHNLAIFEAGISKPGEMEKLARMIRPTIGVLTHIGEAHAEGFSSINIKIEEKLSLFTDSELLIYGQDFLNMDEESIPAKKKFNWGYTADADLNILSEQILANQKVIRAHYQDADMAIHIPFTDAASVENAISCWAVLLAMGKDEALLAQRLQHLHPVQMRLELKKGINDCSIIDDSYSCDVSSMVIAIDFLNQQKQHEQRTLILSDIPESGSQPEVLYRQVARIVQQKHVDRFIGIGPEISSYASLFGTSAQFYPSTEAFLEAFAQISFNDEAILIKGARAYEFERISKLLVQKVHETVLEINMNALEHNLNHYKALLKPGVKTMAMVKAFAYGSGSSEIANLLQFNRVDYLAVAYADEGISLRQAGITLPIMVMNPDLNAIDTIIAHRLEPEIYSFRIFKAFELVLKRQKIENYPVHLKLDTGMRRLGFVAQDISELGSSLQNTSVMKVQSIFSHLAAAEDPQEDVFTQSQIELFDQLSGQIQAELKYPILRHLANTSGISRWVDAQFDMVRLGIGLYGIDKSYKAGTSPLQTVTTLKTSVSQIKNVLPNETIGYNRKGVLPQGGQIATVKIGYADGYLRALGNGHGQMLINGQKVPTIGNICMDMCMLDVSGIQVKEGDEVIVFNEQIRVEDLAKTMQTIPYEVLTGISQRVKRIYYYE